MSKTKENSTYFYCFNPTVMFATFIIEAFLAAYLFLRYKMTLLIKLAIFMLLSLATFQLAEYMVCEGDQSNAMAWSRIGYVAITLLPAIGVHIVQIMTRSKAMWAVQAAYLLCLAFVITFSFGDAFSGHSCEGNYVIFQLYSPFGGAFFMYYFTLLIGTIIWAFNVARTATAKLRNALHFYILGYFVFIVPALLINVWKPHTLAGLPSIMCGFAILFALIFTFLVIPRVQDKKQ